MQGKVLQVLPRLISDEQGDCDALDAALKHCSPAAVSRGYEGEATDLAEAGEKDTGRFRCWSLQLCMTGLPHAMQKELALHAFGKALIPEWLHWHFQLLAGALAVAEMVGEMSLSATTRWPRVMLGHPPLSCTCNSRSPSGRIKASCVVMEPSLPSKPPAFPDTTLATLFID